MKYKINFVSVLTLMILVTSLALTACASSQNVKRFEYQSVHYKTKEKMGMTSLYIKDDEVEGATVWYRYGTGMNQCDNTEKKAVKSETATEIIYTTEPKLAGCAYRRYIVSKVGGNNFIQSGDGNSWFKGTKFTPVD